MNLKKKSELARFILEKETPYIHDKNIIHELFNKDLNYLSKEIIENQLLFIDSYYSTNMSRRYYGIEEIAESILNISSSPPKLKNYFIEYCKAPEESLEISDTFHKKYGYSKKGKKYGKSFSLISKYAYFLTDFNFPIYDSIVMEIYPMLRKGEKLNNVNFDVFVRSMNEFLNHSQIESFNQLDNLLWLIGKIRRGNYSLILKKKQYIELVGKIKGLESLKSSEIDKSIRDFVFQNIDKLSDIFTENQKEMIVYSKSLKKN